ncbi:MAG: hypothetical protein C4K49_04790 [Candidatus Thorarchaeota archaeon]|nr:MAG: hypothetical protein C4K49_04790 [Candidatus Thorarchaeota archaeon]
MKLIVVGSGPGGMAAAYAAKMLAPDAEVRILTEETVESHRRPGSALALEFPDTKDLFISDWSSRSLVKKGIEVSKGVSVIGGDLKSGKLRVKERDGSISSLQFDRLILATGGRPVLPDIPGVKLSRIYTIKTLADTRRIGRVLKSIDSVVIVGAGFSGLETAERLYQLGKEVHVVVRSRLMRRLLEEPLSEELRRRIPKDIHLHIGSAPKAIKGNKSVTGIVIDGEEIKADAVTFMTGVTPNVDLAGSLGLAIGSLGGVTVNSKLETSTPGVYAVGDCVEMPDSLTGKPVLMPVGSAAARAGRQAAAYAVGRDKEYPDVSLRFQYDRLFGTDIVCVGHSSVTASDLGLEVKAHYLDDGHEYMKVALITGPDGRLVGGQVMAARMGAVVGYQIMERVQSGTTLEEKPLLTFRHERAKEVLERTFGPIR